MGGDAGEKITARRIGISEKRTAYLPVKQKVCGGNSATSGSAQKKINAVHNFPDKGLDAYQHGIRITDGCKPCNNIIPDTIAPTFWGTVLHMKSQVIHG